MPLHEVEINPRFSRALRLMELGSSNVFVTGRAGTGKSTLLRYFRAHTGKRVAVLAPTGVAALNVGGETVHSFFRFGADITPDKVRRLGREKAALYRELDTIVIDEISMVRADLLDCADVFMRLHGPRPERPFGGVQLVMIGDLHQLPPVVRNSEEAAFRGLYASPFFFDAKCFPALRPELAELKKVYRQSDPGFIELLDAVREGSVTPEQLEALNRRVGAAHDAREGRSVELVTTNAAADAANAARLAGLGGPEYNYWARVTGDFPQDCLPAPRQLTLKRGAQVMLLNNDPHGRWVNGSMAAVEQVIKGRDGAPDAVLVQLSSGELEEVLPCDWELFHYGHRDGRLITETAGTFRQYPLRPAWAITVHKSQGKTFNRVSLHLGDRAFAAGQTYVALSRCTSMDGLALGRPVRRGDIITDPRVLKFMRELRAAWPQERSPEDGYSMEAPHAF